MQRLLIIANPAASQFTGGAIRRVRAILGESYNVSVEWPTSAAEAKAVATEASIRNIEVVCAMGGDGAAHHVANGLAGSDTAMAIVPAGTTNVTARIIGLSQKPAKAASQLRDGSVVSMTLVKAEYGDSSVTALFAIGVGFDAAVVQHAEARPESKGTLGSLHYARSAAIVAIGDYRTRHPFLSIDCDGETTRGVAAMVQVHNPYTYFGRLPLHLGRSDTPTAFAVEQLPTNRALAIAWKAAARRDVSSTKGASIWPEFQELTIKARDPVAIQADGDIVGIDREFLITVSPDALNMLVPAP